RLRPPSGPLGGPRPLRKRVEGSGNFRRGQKVVGVPVFFQLRDDRLSRRHEDVFERRSSLSRRKGREHKLPLHFLDHSISPSRLAQSSPVRSRERATGLI